MTSWPLRPTFGPPYPKPKDPCASCPLQGNGRGFAYPETGGTNGVGLVGESLGEQEALRGDPFVGPAGWQLNQVLKRAGIERSSFNFVGNLIWCQPPNNRLAGAPYEMHALEHCEPLLTAAVRDQQPRALVALGALPMRQLTGRSGGIHANRGWIATAKSQFGSLPVVGTFHPSYLLPRKHETSGAKFTWVIIMDLRRALRLATGWRPETDVVYLEDPPMDRAKAFVAEYFRTGPDTVLGWDTETNYKMQGEDEEEVVLDGDQRPIRGSFAFRSRYAMSIPYDPLWRKEIWEPLLGANRPKVGWNSKSFDEPLMIFREGLTLRGILHDGMNMFHTFQPNINRGLEFVSSILASHLQRWKYLAQSEPAHYSAIDADATITNFYELRDLMKGIVLP